MIDHVSIAVRDLSRSKDFYEQLLETIGYAKLDEQPATVGFGKKYPDLWLNLRPDVAATSDGFHVCLRARSPELVRRFHERALELGATDDGAPGVRPEYADVYYASFIRDFDGNRIEVVTFLTKS